MKPARKQVKLIFTGIVLAFLLHYPVVSFFSSDARWMGIPAFLIYLFIVWVGLLLALHRFTKDLGSSNSSSEDE